MSYIRDVAFASFLSGSIISISFFGGFGRLVSGRLEDRQQCSHAKDLHILHSLCRLREFLIRLN